MTNETALTMTAPEWLNIAVIVDAKTRDGIEMLVEDFDESLRDKVRQFVERYAELEAPLREVGAASPVRVRRRSW
jgi:hypothetical protein